MTMTEDKELTHPPSTVTFWVPFVHCSFEVQGPKSVEKKMHLFTRATVQEEFYHESEPWGEGKIQPTNQPTNQPNIQGVGPYTLEH